MSFDRRNANPLSCHLLYLGLKRGFVSVFCFECMIIMQTRPSSATWHSVLRSKAHLLCNHKPISPWRRWTRHGIMQYTTMSKKKKRVLRRTSFPKCRAMHAFVPRIPKDFPPRRRFPINNFFCCGQEFFFPSPIRLPPSPPFSRVESPSSSCSQSRTYSTPTVGDVAEAGRRQPRAWVRSSMSHQENKPKTNPPPPPKKKKEERASRKVCNPMSETANNRRTGRAIRSDVTSYRSSTNPGRVFPFLFLFFLFFLFLFSFFFLFAISKAKARLFALAVCGLYAVSKFLWPC